MCILKDCEEPTQHGVWWRDDTEWCLYSAHHQALIKKGIAEQLKKIDLGTIVFEVHPFGARYILNLHEMKQVAKSSGQKRPVMVVDTPTVTTERRLSRSAEVPPKKSFKELPLNLHYTSDDGSINRYDVKIERARHRLCPC